MSVCECKCRSVVSAVPSGSMRAESSRMNSKKIKASSVYREYLKGFAQKKKNSKPAKQGRCCQSAGNLLWEKCFYENTLDSL